MRKTAKERKAIKKAKETKNPFVSTNDEIGNFVKILIIVLGLIAAFWLITIIVTHKSTNDNSATTIQYSKIIVGSILNRSEESYYVLVEASGDENLSTYQSSIDSYLAKDEHLKFYTVDLSDGFNEKYLADSSNLDITDINEIRFNGTVLLKIDNHQISEKITEASSIQTYLADLSA